MLKTQLAHRTIFYSQLVFNKTRSFDTDKQSTNVRRIPIQQNDIPPYREKTRIPRLGQDRKPDHRRCSDLQKNSSRQRIPTKQDSRSKYMECIAEKHESTIIKSW